MSTTATAERGDRLGDLAERRRGFLATTPGQLRAESIVVVISALLAGLLVSLVVTDQLSNARRIADEAEPTILNARRIQTSLAEANAAAATALLIGGVEDETQRDVYDQSLLTATEALEEATRLADEAPADGDGARTDADGDRLAPTLSSNIVEYASLIETARANNRQGFPVSAAYLSAASALLENEIYPQTDAIANDSAREYRDAYNRQRGLALVLGVMSIVLVVAVVLMLVYVQFQLRRRFNRTLNLPLLGAALLAIGLALWMTLAMASQLGHLTAARDDGYAGTRLYLDLRGTGFGAKADQARFLIARGAGDAFDDDFEQRSAMIEALRSDLDLHAEDSNTAQAQELAILAYDAWLSYDQVHDEIVEADDSGERELAVDLAQVDAEASFERFDLATAEALDTNNQRFTSEMTAARRAMRWLRFGSLVVAILIAGLAAYGIQLRIDEYR
jgi:hypothetical protein